MLLRCVHHCLFLLAYASLMLQVDHLSTLSGVFVVHSSIAKLLQLFKGRLLLRNCRRLLKAMAMALLLLGLLLEKLIYSVGLSHLLQSAIVREADLRLVSRVVRPRWIVGST